MSQAEGRACALVLSGRPVCLEGAHEGRLVSSAVREVGGNGRGGTDLVGLVGHCNVCNQISFFLDL